jgi:FMN reductase
MILLLSFSLNPKSKSFKAVEKAYSYLKFKQKEVILINIKDYPLAYYDGTEEIFEQQKLKKLFNIFNNVEKVIIASPVYNYDVNAVLKNFLDLLSVIRNKNRIYKKQVIGIIGAMGSEKSFTCLLPTLSNLQFSLGFYLIPKIVMCIPKDFNENNEVESGLESRIQELCNSLLDYIIA